MNVSRNTKQSFVTRNYILNPDIFYKDCNQSYNKSVYENKEDIYAVNCGPVIKYTCPIPTYPKCWDENETNNINSLVLRNIQQGGLICDNKLRSNINSNISSRILSNYVRPPFDYAKDIETEFYLLHGESSTCSKREWKDRHYK
jgi:hypothetical protein